MRVLSRDEVLQSITRLHEWRKKFNGDNIGYGYDQSRPDEQFHYPEAYAVWGSGYLRLYRATKNEEYLDCARKCYDWLIKNPSPRYKNLSWGLPWAWKEWGAPSDMAYVCTTMYVGDFFVEFHSLDRKDTYLDSASSIYTWLMTENGYRETKNGIDFYYANHEPMKFTIYNQNGLALGFLVKLWNITKDENIRKTANGVLEFLISNQNAEGSWDYSEKRDYIDNFHTAITLEGLANAYESFKSDAIKKSLDKGLGFYRKEFFSSGGKARESVNQPPGGKISPKYLKRYARYQLNQIHYLPYARLWSYGAAIRLFCLFGDEKMAGKVTAYAVRNLQTDDGSFKFKENDEGRFIRNEAHIFDGLASVLE